jgi:hypothetical protein
MTLDTVLNLLWLGIGLAALLLLSLVERRRFPGSTFRGRALRLTAVLVVTVALFPSVSSSDDLFSFSLINSHLGKHGGFGSTLPEDPKEKSNLQLFRLLESLGHYQASHTCTLLFALSCYAFVIGLRRDVFTRAVLCRSGRAPPLA